MSNRSIALSTAVALLLGVPSAGTLAQMGDEKTNDMQPVEAGITGGRRLAASDRPMEQMYVYGEPGKTKTATKLNLSILETPQSVSVVSREQIEDFSLKSVNDLLEYVPGVTVESVETGRTYYTARGFDIVNFQYDGVGVPFTYGLMQGEQDTAIYEQVEVVKGAAGLITGLANPSATINYVRKRPTDGFEASASLTGGEWSMRRVEGDVSGPITSGIRGRFVVADGQSDSYLDRYSEERRVFYGIAEADLSSSTLLTIGHSYNESNQDGNLWGALPLYYTDGTPTDYPVSTSTAPDWAFWDVERTSTFVEMAQQLGARWELKAIYTRNTGEQDSELFYVYGTPERGTELGLAGQASAYLTDEEQQIMDVFVSGSFTLGGRDHDLVAGINRAEIETTARSFSDPVNGFPVLGSDWAEGNTPRPQLTVHDPATDAADIDQEQDSVYLATRFNFTDGLSVLLGARNQQVDQQGFNYGASSETDAEETVPYGGVVYKFTDSFAAYTSYSEVFVQQAWVGEDLQPLGATQGQSSEVGVKHEFNDGQAKMSLALFQSMHRNLGEFVARNDNGVAIYQGRDYESSGVELEVSGRVTEGLNVSFGYTDLETEDEDANPVRTYVPRKMLKFAGAYQFQSLPALKLGGAVDWQDDIYIEPATGVRVTREAYALFDLFARYKITDNLSASVNVNNITDEKHYESLYWDQAFYGPPRHVQASLTWRY